jgi:Putative Flp pilus-assembly TadE/G-like
MGIWTRNDGEGRRHVHRNPWSRYLEPCGAPPPTANPNRTGAISAHCSAGSTSRIRQIARGCNERGAVLPLMALVLVVLMGAAGLAVDLGWLYWQSLEIQHGADAAALAGVIYEPAHRDEAHDQGVAAAIENGFVQDPLNGNAIEIIDFGDDPSAVQHSSQLRAIVSRRVPTIFMKVLGIETVDISRTALAEYVQPLALGSPESFFGNDPALGNNPRLWASVHGTYGPQGWGDRYTALCDGNGNTYADPTCTPTGEGRPSVSPGTIAATGGYLYGIELEPGSSGLAVEIFDGPYYDSDDALEWTGDFGSAAWFADPMATTWFMLYGPDVTPLDTTDGNELLCAVRYEARTSRADDFAFWNPAWTSFDDISPGELNQMWDDMISSSDITTCASDFDRGPGIYPLRVMVEHSDDWWTTNKYSLRTSTSSGPSPKVYGLGDMSIYNNVDNGATEFYLTRVEEKHRGTMLVVELWDAGDVNTGGSGDTVTISSGNGSTLDCTWSASNGDSGSTCIINVSAKIYNDHLITIQIPIPQDYTCSGDECWFRATYDYTGSGTHDTTTWTAYIVGNPIHLVE